MSLIKKNSVGRRDLFMVKPQSITIESGYNIRENLDIEELKASIRENGVKQPIAVRQDGDNLYLVQGHRRLSAVMELIAEGVEIEAIPAFPVRLSNEDRIVDLITSNDGAPLKMHEQGSAYLRLESFGWSTEKIAQKVGKTVAHISNCLKLARMPKEVRDQINAGMLAPSVALDLSRKEKGEKAFIQKVETAVSQAKTEGKKKVTAKITKKRYKLKDESKALVIEALADLELDEEEKAHIEYVLSKHG